MSENKTQFIEFMSAGETKNSSLFCKINIEKAMKVLTLANPLSGRANSIFEESTVRNDRGAQLYYFPDDDLGAYHLYGYLHENTNKSGQKKGRVLEEVIFDTDSNGIVMYLSLKNANGRVEIFPYSDRVDFEIYDPDNPPITMYKHRTDEIKAGRELPYTVVPNGSLSISKLTPEQFSQIRQIMEAGIQFMEPSLKYLNK